VAAGLVIGRCAAAGAGAAGRLCCVIFAAVMAVAALSRWALPVYLALVAAGAAWMAVMNTFNTATQTSAPPWVRSRATAMHVLSALGPFALGSALWGGGRPAGPAGRAGAGGSADAGQPAAGAALPAAHGRVARGDAGTLQGPAGGRRARPGSRPGGGGTELPHRPGAGRGLPGLGHPAAGPRQRDGATFWRLYRDLDDRRRFVERFIVTSWADYLHQRARQTVADQALKEGLRRFLAEGEVVKIRHYLAER
jgi:hypothetical protein